MSGSTISERWTGARLLMAEKKLNDFVGTESFDRVWSDLIQGIERSDELERLLYVDLVIRISSFIKKLKRKVEAQLPLALSRPLPCLAQVSNTKALPDEAKPAEIRENVALALAYADGDYIGVAVRHRSKRSVMIWIGLTSYLTGLWRHFGTAHRYWECHIKRSMSGCSA